MPAELTCSVEDIRALVMHQLDVLWANPELAWTLSPLMLWGPPGVGKSTVIREVCKERNIGFVDIRLAQREPIDLRGLPVPRGDTVDWLVSSEWPRDEKSRGIILFDELTAADRTLQVAAYELILDRRLGTLYSVPPGWFLVAAGNRAQDRAVAGAMSSALANRFCHLDVEPDLAGWLTWARARGLHPHVLSFLQMRPTLFLDMANTDLQRGWPSPRTWERVSVTLSTARDLAPGRVRRLVEGLVGPGAAAEFAAFRAIADALPDIPALLQERGEVVVPASADQRYALCEGMAYHLWRVPRRAMALERLFDVLERLTPDFAAMLLGAVLRGRASEDVASVLSHRRFAQLRTAIGPALAGRLNKESDAVVNDVLAGLLDD